MLADIKLRLPLKNIWVTQPFGVNFVDFYQKMGLSGHPGVDFRSYDGCQLYAANDGVVTLSGSFSDGGLGIEIWNNKLGFGTFYYHLKQCDVKIGDEIKAGQKIGLTDNTGKYTTGDHLHFELRVLTNNGISKIDPAGYFCYNKDGMEFNPKDWDKSTAYHRYWRGRPKGGLINELKVAASLTKYFKRLPSNEEINACTYGGYDRETVLNPNAYMLWAFIKKDEYSRKEYPFI